MVFQLLALKSLVISQNQYLFSKQNNNFLINKKLKHHNTLCLEKIIKK